MHDLDISCNTEIMQIGTLNNICEVKFNPNNKLRGNGQIFIELEGVISIKTSICQIWFNETGSWEQFSIESCTVEGAGNQNLRIIMNETKNDGYGP